MKKSIIINLAAAASILSLSACATSQMSAQSRETQNTKTVLDDFKPDLQYVESRLLVSGFQGQLTPEDNAALKNYAFEYARTGRGNISISYPNGGIIDGTTDALIRAVQRQLYVEGVDFKQMSFGAYTPNGNDNPLVLSFNRTQASEVKCKPWSEINANKVGTSETSPRFGCAEKANLAAMLVDPGDLRGDRKDALPDAIRTEKVLNDYHEGKIEQVSASATKGNN